MHPSTAMYDKTVCARQTTSFFYRFQNRPGKKTTYVVAADYRFLLIALSPGIAFFLHPGIPILPPIGRQHALHRLVQAALHHLFICRKSAPLFWRWVLIVFVHVFYGPPTQPLTNGFVFVFVLLFRQIFRFFFVCSDVWVLRDSQNSGEHKNTQHTHIC